MTLILDAGPLISFENRGDPQYERVDRLLRAEPGSLVLPAPITAEVDYLLTRRFGKPGRRAFLEDLAAGRFVVRCLEPEDCATVLELERRYSDLSPGLADLSIVLLAHRYGTKRVATFDERHFRALRPLDGGSFTLLPADE